MINFILPHCFDNQIFNTIFADYIHNFPEHLNFKERVNIYAYSGNAPFSFWHGGINTDYDNDVYLQPRMIDLSIKLNAPIILDFSNIYLDTNENWIKDPHIQMTLKTFENKGNFIKVSDSQIIETINQHTLGYDYILKLSDVENYNVDAIDKYQFIELHDLTFNSKKHNILYPLCNPCIDCPKKHECQMNENFYQYTFSGKTSIGQCSNFIFDAQEEYKKYCNARLQGYTMFYFDDIPISRLDNFNAFLVQFFIKPEYFQHFNKELEKL